MPRTTVRIPCPMCDTTGEIADAAAASGWVVCPECLGQCWMDETPQPHGEPHPDPLPVSLE